MGAAKKLSAQIKKDGGVDKTMAKVAKTIQQRQKNTGK